MMEEMNEVRIGRFLSGETVGDERIAFLNELEANPGLKQDFNTYQRIWKESTISHDEVWNTEKAWNRFSQSNIQSSESVTRSRTIYLKWVAAAAAVIGITTLFFLWNAAKPVTYVFTEKNHGIIDLADGSKVYLNKGASLQVKPFNHKRRNVTLTGEAFFEVSPDPARPFRIISGKTVTEVVGTAFNITQKDENTRIFVQKGKVIFTPVEHQKDALALTAGEAAIFAADHMQLIPNPSPNMNAWHTRHLTFTKNMSFAEIIEDASAYFGRPITLENNALKNCLIGSTLNYTDPDLNAVLKPLASFINGTIKIDGDKCSIVGGVCP